MSDFLCTYCGMRFPNYMEGLIHEDVCMGGKMMTQNHDEHKPFVCCHCGLQFTNYTKGQDHEDKHEQREVQQQYLCPSCGEILNTESDFKFHELFHEMDQIDYSDQKPWSPISLGNYEPTTNQAEELMDVDPDQCGITNMETDTEESMYSQPRQSQVGYGDEKKLPYNLRLVGEKTFKKNSAIDKNYQVRFDTDSVEQGQRLSDLHRELENTFNDALSQATQGLDSSTDLGRVIIHHEGLTNPVYVPLKPLKDLTGKVVMGHLQNVLTSHENLSLDHSFYLNVGTIKIPKGGTGARPINKLGDGKDSMATKKSCIKIWNSDELCLARSICMGFLKLCHIPTADWRLLIDPNDGKTMEERVMELRKCPTWYYKQLTTRTAKGEECQKSLATLLCKKANKSTERRLSILDIAAFENVLNVDILVLSSTVGNKFIRTIAHSEEGKTNSRQRLFLYHSERGADAHFDAIVNICGLFAQSKFCHKCLKPYQKKHKCASTCMVCKRTDHCFVDQEVSCRRCHMTCRSLECFKSHKLQRGRTQESQCDRWWKCTVCKKIVDRHLRRPEDHLCGEWQCQACKQFVNVDHLCYMRALECKEKKPRYIFFDFECTQDDVLCCAEGYSATRNPNCVQCNNNTESCLECALCTNCQQSWCGKFQHIPNLVVAQKVCEQCIAEQVDTKSKCDNCGTRCGNCDKIDKEEKTYANPPCKDTCGFRETVFQGDNIAHVFGSWLFNKTHKDFTVVAHNMKGYDGYFLLEYLLANSIVPKVIYAGSKIMYLHVERGLNIRVLDSLNFLPMKLAELPKAFGLEEMKKGYFPNFFNTKKNFNYIGPYPASRFYGSDMMNAKGRQEFLAWYHEKVESNETFDFAREILEYCRSDVNILRQACLKFRDILVNITGKQEVIFEEELPETKCSGSSYI